MNLYVWHRGQTKRGRNKEEFHPLTILDIEDLSEIVGASCNDILPIWTPSDIVDCLFGNAR